MGRSIKIAFLNLWRRKSRSFVVIAMVAVGMGAMIFIQGFYDGMINQMFDDVVRTGEGEINITKVGYRESKLVKDHLKHKDYVEFFLNVDNVFYVVERLKTEGMVSSSRFSQGAFLVGTFDDKEKNFIAYNKPMLKGEFVLLPDEKVAVIGHMLADKLKVGVGRKIVIQAQNSDGQIVSTALRVGGILKSNNTDLDNRGVLMHINHLKELLGIDAVTEISFIVNDKKKMDETKLKIQDLWFQNFDENADIKTFLELNPIYKTMEESVVIFISIAYFVICLAIAMGVFNIMMITIYERMKEYGVLQALGTPVSGISALVYFESIILCGLGYLIAVVIGVISLGYFSTHGLDLSVFADGLDQMGIASIVFAEFHLRYFVMAFIAIVLTAIISVIIPIRKLKKLRPMQSIRFS